VPCVVLPVSVQFVHVSQSCSEDVACYREYLEDLLISNRVKLLVATIALGMGFDKRDIGFVVHFQVCIKTEFLRITITSFCIEQSSDCLGQPSLSTLQDT